MDISLTDLEDAINYWRNLHPSTGEEQKLCSEAGALAEPYALMIMGHRRQIGHDELAAPAQRALADWWQARLGPYTEPTRP